MAWGRLFGENLEARHSAQVEAGIQCTIVALAVRTRWTTSYWCLMPSLVEALVALVQQQRWAHSSPRIWKDQGLEAVVIVMVGVVGLLVFALIGVQARAKTEDEVGTEPRALLLSCLYMQMQAQRFPWFLTVLGTGCCMPRSLLFWSDNRTIYIPLHASRNPCVLTAPRRTRNRPSLGLPRNASSSLTCTSPPSPTPLARRHPSPPTQTHTASANATFLHSSS